MASQGTTFGDLKTFVKDNLFHGVKVDDNRRIERAVLNGHEHVVTERDWSWQLVQTLRILTIVPYSTGTVSGSAGSPNITGSGTTFTAAMEGRFIKFANLPELYEIRTRSSDTAIILWDNLSAAVTAGTTFEVFAIRYDLPDNFREMRKVVDLSRRTDPPGIEPTDETSFELALATWHNAGGFPEVYATLNKRDSVKRQVGFLPPPREARYYQVHYLKHAGWRNASTAAFETVPTADSSIVEWPREYRFLLEKAILLEAASEFKNDQWMRQAAVAYNMVVRKAAGKDQIMQEPSVYGQGPVTTDPRLFPRFFDQNGVEIR